MSNSFTSPTLADALDYDGKYEWDCCNIDYCKDKRKSKMPYGFRCLRGAVSPRCNREEKWEARIRAKASGFRFPVKLADASE